MAMPSRTSRANRPTALTWEIAAFWVRQAAREVRHAARAVLHWAWGWAGGGAGGRGRAGPGWIGRGGWPGRDPSPGWGTGGGQKGPGPAAERSPVTRTDIARPTALTRR